MMRAADNFDWKKPDYTPIILERIKRLDKIRKDPTGQLLRALKAYYAQGHYADFISDWMNTHDPRRDKMQYMPFLLFKRQREYIEWLHDKKVNKSDGLVEKSRDMGLTWLCAAYAVCLLLFEPGSKVGFGSRKEDLVDKLGDPDSIFEKIRFLLRTLPVEFLPRGFSLADDCHFLKIMNRENGSTITGEGGDNIGRGGRNTIYFKDESAFYEHPLVIDSALSQNSDVKIDVSTPNGANNPFYNKRQGGRIPVFSFHWRDDPRKDDKWYQKQLDTLPAFIVAQEIDIDYQASQEGILIPPKYIRAAIGLAERLGIEPTGMKKAALDVADEEGVDTNGLIMGQGVFIQEIKEWNGINTTQTGRRAWGFAKEFGAEVINYDSVGVGAGVRGEFTSLKENDHTYQPKIRGVNTGETPEDGSLEAGRKNKDMFGNLKAQLWWSLRRRFEKTWEHVEGIKEHPIDDLIGLPALTKENEAKVNQLVNELSQPKYEPNDAGKIVVESKKKMKSRGVKSPNLADAAVLFALKPRILRIR